MAVEARNLLPSQLMGNREMMSVMEGSNMNMYNTVPPGPGYGLPPLSGTTTTTDTLLFPMYGSAVTDSINPTLQKTAAMKADSGLTYAFPVSVSRKRSRDSSTNPLISFPNAHILNHTNNTSNNHSNHNCGGFFTFLGEDISLQIQQQQLEIDRFVTQHSEKVRMEVEEQRKRNSRRIIAAVEEGITKKLRAKEMEVEKIGKLNWALEERVKSLCVENQIWRELAQTNEATANALRTNLEQVLAHVNNNNDHRRGGAALDAAALTDDAQSCCGSNYGGGAGDVEERSLAGFGGEGKVMEDNSRLCRQCGKEESCVLLLPCRHLCLCTVCGSSVQACPVCNSVKNASLRVIMSS